MAAKRRGRRSGPKTISGTGITGQKGVNLIEGIVRLYERGTSEPTNIGNPHEFTVRQLAERVLALTGSKSQLVLRPLPVDDPQVRQPDIAYARMTLDWEPQIGLDEGLRRTIEYFRGVVAHQGAARR